MNPKRAGTSGPGTLALVLKIHGRGELPDLARRLLEVLDSSAGQSRDLAEQHRLESTTDEHDDIQRLEAICSSCDVLLARVQRELRELKLAKEQT